MKLVRFFPLIGSGFAIVAIQLAKVPSVGLAGPIMLVLLGIVFWGAWAFLPTTKEKGDGLHP